MNPALLAEARHLEVSDVLVGNCTADLAIFDDWFGACRPRARASPLPVDASVFRPRTTAGARELLGLDLPAGAVVLGFVSRLVPQKGFHVWLRLLAEVRDALAPRPVRGIVVGTFWDDYGVLPYLTSGYDEVCRRIIDDCDLADAVLFHRGTLDDAGLGVVYAAMDLLVHPTMTVDENFGYTPVEAMAWDPGRRGGIRRAARHRRRRCHRPPVRRGRPRGACGSTCAVAPARRGQDRRSPRQPPHARHPPGPLGHVGRVAVQRGAVHCGARRGRAGRGPRLVACSRRRAKRPGCDCLCRGRPASISSRPSWCLTLGAGPCPGCRTVRGDHRAVGPPEVETVRARGAVRALSRAESGFVTRRGPPPMCSTRPRWPCSMPCAAMWPPVSWPPWASRSRCSTSSSPRGCWWVTAVGRRLDETRATLSVVITSNT